MAADMDEQFEVLIIGGGPVGLASAIQLGRAGIKTLVLERRANFSRHSKAAGVHARTMEIYRQWGLAKTIRDSGGGGDGVFTAGWMTRLNGTELGSITLGATAEERHLLLSWSPELMCLCGQDVYEPILARATEQFPSVEIRLDAEATQIHPDADGVTVGYEWGRVERSVRAGYVIGADGVRSPTRKRLHMPEEAVPSFGNSVNVLFEAPLEAYRDGRRYGLFWIINGDTQGALSWKRRGDIWSYNFEAAEHEDPATYTPERCAELVRRAVGDPQIPVQVISILHWQHDQAVTTRWRNGRVFLAGDAAHRFPPHGGFGMNSGVQDSHNLAWKLIARLRWGAGDAILDTYEPERKPVAERNGEQCLINTRRMAETGWLLKDTSALAAIEKPEGEALRQTIRDSVPKQREQFFSQGQQFGQIYESAAVIADGTVVEQSTVSEYRPTGGPGARAPHVWLVNADGELFSTFDLYDGGFIIFTTPQASAWLDAVDQPDLPDVPLHGYCIGSPGLIQRDGDPSWQETVGLGPTGAILVRPDGHVGMRWHDIPENPAAAIRSVLARILGMASLVQAPGAVEPALI